MPSLSAPERVESGLFTAETASFRKSSCSWLLVSLLRATLAPDGDSSPLIAAAGCGELAKDAG